MFKKTKQQKQPKRTKNRNAIHEWLKREGGKIK
jgi:hypothetical protein